MKQSEIVKKIEEFIEKEFGTAAYISIEPTLKTLMNGMTKKIEDSVNITFRV